MTIIAERGLFVPLLAASGKFEAGDALDAATREPATKADLSEVRNELKADMALLRSDIGLLSQRVDAQGVRIDAMGDRLLVRLDDCCS